MKLYAGSTCGGQGSGLTGTTMGRTVRRNAIALPVATVGYMADVVTPEKLANWDETNAMTSPQVREGVQLIDAFARINAAPPLPKVPAVVLTGDKPWRVDLLPPEVDQTNLVTFDDWKAHLDRLAESLGAVHITETNSGHNIYSYAPGLVVDSVRSVVDEFRGGTSPTPR